MLWLLRGGDGCIARGIVGILTKFRNALFFEGMILGGGLERERLY